jgi:hypothetical protein
MDKGLNALKHHRMSSKHQFQEESQDLIQLVAEYGEKKWKKVAQLIGGTKTGAQCGKQLTHLTLIEAYLNCLKLNIGSVFCVQKFAKEHGKFNCTGILLSHGSNLLTVLLFT